MTFGEKLKKLRTDNKLTQDELADKIFVTRTAVSKWETGRGFPNMESLKMLCKVFDISMDTLISDEELENRKILEDKKAKYCFWGAMAGFLLCVAFTIVSAITKIPYYMLGSFVGVIVYAIFAYYSTPKYKRVEAIKTNRAKFFIPKMIVVIVLLCALLGVAFEIF